MMLTAVKRNLLDDWCAVLHSVLLYHVHYFDTVCTVTLCRMVLNR
jgi:hypothetical protein